MHSIRCQYNKNKNSPSEIFWYFKRLAVYLVYCFALRFKSIKWQKIAHIALSYYWHRKNDFFPSFLFFVWWTLSLFNCFALQNIKRSTTKHAKVFHCLPSFLDCFDFILVLSWIFLFIHSINKRPHSEQQPYTIPVDFGLHETKIIINLLKCEHNLFIVCYTVHSV